MSSLPIPLDRHAPSPSRLLGEKVGSSGFHIWLHFFSTPSFLPEPRSRSVGHKSQLLYLRRASRAAFHPQQDSRTAANWRKILFTAREVNTSFISWNAAEKNPVGFETVVLMIDVASKLFYIHNLKWWCNLRKQASLKVNCIIIVAVPDGGPEIVASSYFLLRKRHFVQLTQLVKYNFLCVFFLFSFLFLA